MNDNNILAVVLAGVNPSDLPLVGVLTAMKWIKKNNKQYQWIATFPSDTPFFDTSIIEKY
jgi:molybdopterin-guanine dinucleotide biosynthesis protein A